MPTAKDDRPLTEREAANWHRELAWEEYQSLLPLRDEYKRVLSEYNNLVKQYNELLGKYMSRDARAIKKRRS